MAIAVGRNRGKSEREGVRVGWRRVIANCAVAAAGIVFTGAGIQQGVVFATGQNRDEQNGK